MRSKLESVLGDYLKEIKKYSLLTAEEERELSLKIRAKSDSQQLFAQGAIEPEEYERMQREAAESRDRMIQANLRLVISVAKHYRNRGLPMEDLVNEGNVGLMNAVDRFDPDMGSRFSTYAGYWIEQAVRRAVLNSQQMIHIPSYLMEKIGHMRLTMRELEESLGRPPSLPEIAEHMGITQRKAAAIAQAICACSTRRQGSASGDGENTLSESLEDKRTPAPFESTLSEADAEFVASMLGRITEREARVLKLRYGLHERNGKRMTLKEIGEEVGLTRERVRQIEREAKEKLVDYMRENM